MRSYTLVEQFSSNGGQPAAALKLTKSLCGFRIMTDYQEDCQQAMSDSQGAPEFQQLHAAALTDKQKMKVLDVYFAEVNRDAKKKAMIQGILAEEEKQAEEDARCFMRKAAEDAQSRVLSVDASLFY